MCIRLFQNDAFFLPGEPVGLISLPLNHLVLPIGSALRSFIYAILLLQLFNVLIYVCQTIQRSASHPPLSTDLMQTYWATYLCCSLILLKLWSSLALSMSSLNAICHLAFTTMHLPFFLIHDFNFRIKQIQKQCFSAVCIVIYNFISHTTAIHFSGSYWNLGGECATEETTLQLPTLKFS